MPLNSFMGIELIGNGTGTLNTAYSDSTRNMINNPRTPSLKCTNVNDRFTVSTSNGNGALTYPIGLITDDELTLSGAGNIDFADANNITMIGTPDFYLLNGDFYWIMTPMAFAEGIANVYEMGSLGFVLNNSVSKSSSGVRPVISLKPDAITGGDGTMNNPFTV